MNKKLSIKILTLSLFIFLLTPIANVALAATEPTIVSEAAIVVDYETGEIIYEKNANEKMYLASTTKIMTALLFAEKAKKSDQITYTEDALAQPPYTMNSEQMLPYGKSFKVGDTLDADTVMKELLLFSGNDTAIMVADYVGGSVENFVNMMNEKATELGLKNTKFGNPNGLPINGVDVNQSTAYEMTILTKAAFQNDWIRETMQTASAQVVLPGNTNINIENRNSELNKNGNIGGKTGVTDAAGTCFAGVYERNDKKYLSVVLKCDRNDNSMRFTDLDAMLDYTEGAEKSVYKKSGEKVGTVELEYKLFGFFGPTKTIKAPIILSEDALIYNTPTNTAEANITFNTSNKSAWNVASENKVNLTLSIRDYSTKVKGEINISTSKILKANIGIYIATIAIILVVLVLIIIIIKLISSSKRNKRKNYYRRR